MADRPYSRLYWSVMNDAKFDGVREDLRLFGAWALLLIHAEMTYPSPAFRPPIVSVALIKRLTDHGLIDLLPDKRYRIHGLASEREMRSHSARIAAASRWNMPRKEEKRKEEKGVRNAVDRDPLYREMREAIKAKEG